MAPSTKNVSGIVRKRLYLVLGILLVSAAFCLLSLALHFQQRVDANIDLLSKTVGKSLPKLSYDSIIAYNSAMKTTIPLFIAGGIILMIIGLFLCLFPKISGVVFVFALVILSPMIFPETLVHPVNAAEKNRWYAEVYLKAPTDAVSIGGHIYVYDNHISTYEYSFVAFSMVILKYDALSKLTEWLEVGYFQNRSGFWIYAASYIVGKGYVENDWSKFNGNGAKGESYYSFWIEAKKAGVADYSPNTFQAYYTTYLLMQATFTISDQTNIYSAGSETSDTENTLNGHFSNLKYLSLDNTLPITITYSWHPWEDVESYADSPYSVTIGSANEFYTEGGEYTPPPPPYYSNPNLYGCGGSGGRMPRPC